MIQVTRAVMPNFFTAGNMFCGFMSVIFAAINRDFTTAAWMIMLASFLDAMDGKVARLTNTSSKFGVEYDSLADVISFGLAPSILIYSFIFAEWKTVGIFISFFPLLFGSIRLARFNVQLEDLDKSHFTGLPSPIAAGALASYIIFNQYFFPGFAWPNSLLVLTFIVSILMVSRIRYEIVPNFTFRGDKRQKILILLLIVGGILFIIFPKQLLFPYTLIYILSGIIRFLYRLAWRRGIRR